VGAVLNKTADSAEAEARLTQRFMEWRLIAPALATEMQQNPRMSDAAVRAQQLGKLGSLGLQALAQRDPGNQALGGLVPKGELIAPDQQSAVIDDAQKPAALVRFTFLDSLRKLVTATSASGAIH
jgi:hexosaminidase